MKKIDSLVQVKRKLDSLVVDPNNACLDAALVVNNTMKHECLHAWILSAFACELVLTIFGVEYFELGCSLADTIHWVGLEQVMLLETKSLLTTVLSLMVENVEEQMTKVSASMIRADPYRQNNDSKNQFAQFFHYFSVNDENGDIKLHETCTEEGFVYSQFRVNYICSFGSLVLFLRRLEGEAEVAFNQCCRNGEVCLIQMTLRTDPMLVHVIDIWALGKKAFEIATSSGISLRSVLNSRTVTKVWFDGWNFGDALKHQVDIEPHNVLDVQLAYVLCRGQRGNVGTYLPGLAQCVSDCCKLDFLKHTSQLAEDLCGNDAIFTKRPLHPALIIFAAARSRYLFDLQDVLAKELDSQRALAK